MKIASLTLLICFFFVGCSRVVVKNPELAMRKVQTPQLADKLSSNLFFDALLNHINGIKDNKKIPDLMIFGKTKISKDIYIKSLELLMNQRNNQDWKKYIENNFDFYEVYGDKEWGEVLTTGYYEPIVKGSKTPSDIYSAPIYKKPNDLIRLNLKDYKEKKLLESSLDSIVGRIENSKFVPYYDRKEIVLDQVLKNKNLEIAYLNPVDAFFIEIQGSGKIQFEDGGIIGVGYSEQNGYPYTPIGKFLKEVIPLEKMSMQRIRKHLKSLNLINQLNLMNKNQSFVFFQKNAGNAKTYLGIDAFEGRTIAADKNIFPKGALCFLDVDINLHNNEDIDPIGIERTPRFVFDQDLGGAVKGTGHIDLYFGSGEISEMRAGSMKNIGKLYYLAPKVLRN